MKTCLTCGHKSFEVADDHDFTEWWAIYPRKAAKPRARKAFFSATDNRVDFPLLMEKTKDFAFSVVGKNKQYIPHPATWLNGDCWDDELLEDDDPDLKGICAI